MRYLFALLLPLAAFGQGFGGFRTDQPFLAADSTAVTPGPGIEYWWVASDVLGSTFTNWVDRIQGRTLGATNGASISVANGSLVFARSAAKNIITNGTAGPVSVYRTNVATSLIVELNPNLSDNGFDAEPLLRSYEDSSAQDLYLIRTTTGSPISLRRSVGGSATEWVTDITTDQLIDITIVNTNADPVNAYDNIYVNGVFQTALLKQHMRFMDFSASAVIYGANYVGLNAKLKEIIIQTNTGVYAPGYIASQVHSYKLAKYPLNPADWMVVKLDASQGVLDPYDAAATNGAKVKTWTNLVQTAYPFTQATAANQGIYYASGGPNDKPFVKFPLTNSTSASGMWNNNAAFDYGQPNTMFMVLRVHTQSGIETIFDAGNVNPYARNAISYISSSKLFELYAGSVLDGPSTIATNVWYILTSKFHGANSLMRTNGVLYKSGDAGTGRLLDGLYINDTPQSGNYAGKHDDYAEIRMYRAGLSSNEIYAVESELATKYGITIP